MRAALALAVSVLLLACGDGGDYTAAATAPPEPCGEYGKEVVVLGDSISWMDGYTTDIEDQFGESRVVNVSFPGWATWSLLPHTANYRAARMDRLKPRVAVIHLGTNDGRDSWHTSASDYWTSMNTIIEDLKLHAKRIILITSPRYLGAFFTTDEHQRLAQYVDVIRDLCLHSGEQVECGPRFDLLLEREHMDVFGLHPNVEGHEIYTGHLMPQLMKGDNDSC